MRLLGDAPHRLPAWIDRRLDPAIAGGMTLLLGFIALAHYPERPGPWHRWVVPVVYALSQGVPLVWRRRRPLVVLAVIVAGALLLWMLQGSRPAPPSAMIALYTVASRSDRRTSLRALGLASLIGIPLVAAMFPLRSDEYAVDLIRLGFQTAVIVAAWLGGEMVRARRQYLMGLEARAAQLERERETNARRAVAEEQARIARELHDVIAHNVSVMVVQAGAADEVFDERPEEARAALRTIDAAGREALAELRRLLGNVKPDDDDPLAPQPSLERLDALVDRVRAAGLRVAVSVAGTPRKLPAGIDLSAYRIIQEALTNVLRHAQASEVLIRVMYGDDAVRLDIRDDGVGLVNGDGADGGNGIVGMRQRAALAQGSLEAGPEQGGGFAVRARLPIAEEAQ